MDQVLSKSGWLWRQSSSEQAVGLETPRWSSQLKALRDFYFKTRLVHSFTGICKRFVIWATDSKNRSQGHSLVNSVSSHITQGWVRPDAVDKWKYMREERWETVSSATPSKQLRRNSSSARHIQFHSWADWVPTSWYSNCTPRIRVTAYCIRDSSLARRSAANNLSEKPSK